MVEERLTLEFMPGFSCLQGTKVKSTFENSSFNLEYTGARSNERRNHNSRGFESCYDWTDVAHVLLTSLENFEDVKTFEDLTQQGLLSWFMTYQGWGLLSCLLPDNLRMMYMKSLRLVKRNWSMNFEGECTDEKCCNQVVQSSFKDLFPKIVIKIMDNNDLPSSGRRKLITVVKLYC